jgi:DNA-binding IclR family transcriptional regulator
VVLSPEDLSDTDNRILEQLQEGRVTPQYLADQLDISRPYASDKLRRFVEHGHVERLASGLYELKNDPRN